MNKSCPNLVGLLVPGQLVVAGVVAVVAVGAAVVAVVVAAVVAVTH